jgi:thiosulfate/3-mercaptopyruvate sulfurtransferase
MKRLSFKLLFFLPLIALFASCSQTATETVVTPESLLVSASEVQTLKSSENYIIIDMRAEGFDEEHIPGAVWFGGAPALVDTTHEVSDFLIDSATFQDIMRSVGVNKNSKILIYDDGNSLGSARLFFALELNGHPYVRILNGGLQAWKAEGFETSTEAFIPTTGNFVALMNDERICDVSYVVRAVNDENVIILDARSPEEFSGENVRAERGGHIPNAVNLEWRNFVEAEGIPFFRSSEEIEALLAEKGITRDKEIVTHCQTNVRGAHAYFTLRKMGFDQVRTYEGSWAEWGNRQDTPISN